MLKMATAGVKPCATTDEPSGHNNGGCAFCDAPADGFDAKAGAPLCKECSIAFSDFRREVVEVRDE
jgi:hypothetical protein